MAGAVVALAAACTDTTPPGVSIASGWEVEVVRSDLDHPTQATLGRDGITVFVAELAGGEDAGTGRVRDLGDAGVARDPIEMVDGLGTPTGLLVTSPTRLVVQERQRLTEVLLEGETPFAPSRPPTGAVTTELAGDLPFNGRSQGSLTLLPGDVVLHVATGVGAGPDPTEGSGVLYATSEDDPRPVPVATGFKNAYAHALGPDGELYVTEIGDGQYDGEPPHDALHVIPPGKLERALEQQGPLYHGGWPRCTGDADPTEEFGATADECEALPRPLATFPPRSTPTSVAVTPEGRVLVALWVEGRVVEVDPYTGDQTDVLTGVGRPQHLLVLADGSLLLTVHDRGELWRLTPPVEG